MEMATKVFALGNSNAVRLPKPVMAALSLRAEDLITIEVINDREMVLKKSAPQTQYPPIKVLFEGYCGDYKPVEAEAFDTVGREEI
jgi:antitoxin component of MazEF toxin-antitoxin module